MAQSHKVRSISICFLSEDALQLLSLNNGCVSQVTMATALWLLFVIVWQIASAGFYKRDSRKLSTIFLN